MERGISKGANILVVDDTAANLTLLTRMLKDCGYVARPVPSGRLALQAARHQKPDLVLLDISMPEMDGYEVCRQMKVDPALRDVPVLFISGLSETADKLKAFNAGGLDYITKPFQFEEVRARVETHLHLHGLETNLQAQVSQKVQEVINLEFGLIIGLAKLAESRDEPTGQHLERIQRFSSLLACAAATDARFAGTLTEGMCKLIHDASPLHDIGKVGIADAILLKPGGFTPEERLEMQRHTSIGAGIVADVRQRLPNEELLVVGEQIVRYHHERWNGKGYPDGLAGEDIPIAARIIAIVDVYDAVRSERPYKAAMTHQQACKIIADGAGSMFDPALTEIFLKMHETFEASFTELQD